MNILFLVSVITGFVLVILKFLHVIECDWWIATLPVYSMIILYIVITVISSIKYSFHKRKIKKGFNRWN